MDDRREGGSLEDARRPDEAVFDVGRVGADSRGRPGLVAFAVALAVIGMVVAGTLDRHETTAVADPSPVTDLTLDTPIASVRPAVETRGAASHTVEPVRLELPGVDAMITGSAVAVRGKLQIKADSVRVELLGPDRRVISVQTVQTGNVDGGIRPLRAPGFDLRLELGMPRPVDAEVSLVITAFDEAGTAIGVARRDVTIGELERPGPW